VNGISVESGIMKVESDTTERFTTENSFTSDSFESRAYVILDFMEILN
jgi:hypothetical protein